MVGHTNPRDNLRICRVKKKCGIRDLASVLRLEDLQPWRLSKQRKTKKKTSASSCRGRGSLEGWRND
jgi:hypothetical protein